MNYPISKLIAGSLAVAMNFPALAAVSQEEAAKLGGELTKFGAIQAGNEEGTIPEYTGGLQAADVKNPSSDWRMADPFKDEKPLFRITGKNVDEYADKLSEGQIHLLKTNPEYYMNIYPTHRTASYPEWVLDNTVRNATTCETTEGGLALEEECRGGLPFPIPETGHEVMWQHLATFQGQVGWATKSVRAWTIDSSGNVTMNTDLDTYTERPYWFTNREDKPKDVMSRAFATFIGPPRDAGRASGTTDFLNPVEKPRDAWSYSTGQRRVRKAPEFAYDTPNPAGGGIMLYDEVFLFSGKMDRFDWKYEGVKEVFIPYNNYKFVYGEECAGEAKFQKNSTNPECERWELHRVRVVTGTLKDGMRHTYSKRRYYWDEDIPNAGVYEAYDQGGSLYRAGYSYAAPRYDLDIPGYMPTFTIYDFSRNSFTVQSDIAGENTAVEPRSERQLSPSTYAGSGIR